MRPRDSRFFLFTMIILAGGVGSAAATTLTVAANGIDADGCGTKATPCRSIGRAIANAVAGDKIVVGPGRYGDLDADGTLGEAGEELGSTGALVNVDKTLSIESLEGAATTLIDVGNADLDGIAINANGVRVGKAKKGFTVSRGGGSGVFIDPGVTGITVSGVRAVSNGRAGFASKGSGLTLQGNVAEAAGLDGFIFTGTNVTITGCRATGNAANGFTIKGSGNILKADVATANGVTGFDFAGDALTLTGSVASGNGSLGLRVAQSSNLTLTGNSFFGNADAGVLVLSPDVILSKSNIFGNGSTGANCGVNTAGAGSVTLDKICFGAPTGPGNDPADAVCGAVAVQQIIEKVLNINPKVPL